MSDKAAYAAKIAAHMGSGVETPTTQESKIFPGSTPATAVLPAAPVSGLAVALAAIRPTRRAIGGKGKGKWGIT